MQLLYLHSLENAKLLYDGRGKIIVAFGMTVIMNGQLEREMWYGNSL
jgi:hypothetical protein